MKVVIGWIVIIVSFLFHAGAAGVPDPVMWEVERFVIPRGVDPGGATMNAYVVFSPLTRQAVLIDPGKVDSRIDAFLRRYRLSLVVILNTHGHSDHTGGNRHYSETFHAPVYAHSGDRFFYRNPRLIELPGQVFFSGEKDLVFSGFTVAVRETPGHSRGSVCYLIGTRLFSGDTLFAGAIGRPAGNSTEEQERRREEEVTAIIAELFVLPDSTPVFPGHREPTTIGAEKTRFPYRLCP